MVESRPSSCGAPVSRFSSFRRTAVHSNRSARGAYAYVHTDFHADHNTHPSQYGDTDPNTLDNADAHSNLYAGGHRGS